jgi:DNA-binding transcriptional regulator LsrR (DeoR family)
MPAERAPMRKVREVLRLRHALGVSERQIAITTGLSRSTVGEYLRRARSYGSARIEAACRRGNDIGATTYGSIKSILQHGLDRAYANDKPPDAPPIQHRNIRGTGYYH